MTHESVLASAAEPARAPKIPESVLVVIHTADLRVLLIERADCPGFWQSVTGSKDYLDEPLRDTAVREVCEETGIAVGGALVPARALRDMGRAIEYEIYPQWRHRYASGVLRNTEHWFALEVPLGIEIRLAPREHVAFAWLPWQDAVQRCFSPSNGEAIRQLVRERDA